MPRTCSVCTHTDRNEIDQALLEGQSLRNIAKQYSGVGATSLHRHKAAGHLAQSLVKAKEVKVELQAETLFDRLRSINIETREILREARESKSSSLALAAINRIEKQIELEARILGQIDEATKIEFGVKAEPPREDPYDLTLLTLDELNEWERLMVKSLRKPDRPRQLNPFKPEKY